jgi:hypothetical protein
MLIGQLGRESVKKAGGTYLILVSPCVFNENTSKNKRYCKSYYKLKPKAFCFWLKQF